MSEHILWETGDEGCPEFIKDRNGEVVLGQCKVCGKGECELTEDCISNQQMEGIPVIHRDDRLCDEGLRCKKCKDNWDKLSEMSRPRTENEALHKKVAELEVEIVSQRTCLLQAQTAAIAINKLLTAEQAKVKVLVDALEYLWDIIDDIDSYGDMAKSDDKTFRGLVENRQKDRWKTGITTDGYVINLEALAAVKEVKQMNVTWYWHPDTGWQTYPHYGSMK